MMNEPARDVTVRDMMEARENRAQKQRKLIEDYHFPVISFTLNVPGPRKVSELLYELYMEGCRRIGEALGANGCKCVAELYTNDVTGYEYYASVRGNEQDLKKIMVGIEEHDLISRLFDIDVIAPNYQIISREQLGLSKRKCLLCGEDAHECSRNRTHSVEELIDYIREIATPFCRDVI